jgi:hypothetical protein
MSIFVVADNSQSDFDQADMNCFLLRTAYKARVLNFKSFWLLMPGYKILNAIQAQHNMNKFFLRHEGHHSLTFQVSSSNWGDSRLTTRHEFHTRHGGLYRLNVEEVLQTAVPFRDFGATCQTVDEVATYRRFFPEAVELSQTSELLAGSSALRAIMKQRLRIFDAADLKCTQHVSDKGVAAAHIGAFNAHRTDLLVIDNDFLPDNPDLLRWELRDRPDISPEYVHLWFSRNPVNNLAYGHGGVKLFPREAQLLRRESNLRGDFTLSVGQGLVIHPVCLGTHVYNWSSFSTWITAAKEVAKLTLAVDTNHDQEAKERLQVWLSVFNPDSAFLAESKSGAKFGNEFPHSVLSADTSEKQRALFANHFEKVHHG